MDLYPLPNLIIAGVAKAGTTSLFWQLADHPDICPSDIKELHYFSPLQHGRPLRPLEEYADHFRHHHDERYRLEASPEYFYGGPAVREAIATTLERPRVIVSLREPVGRVWSAYTFLKSMGRLPAGTTFADAVADWRAPLDEIRAGRAGSLQTPVSVNFYVDVLRAWDERFGDDLRIIFAESLFSDPQATYDELIAWLELAPHRLSDAAAEQRNQTLHARSARLARIAYSAKRYSDQLLRRWPGGRAALRRLYAAMNATAPAEQMDPATRSELEELYAQPNRELAEFLRERGYSRFPEWLQGAETPEQDRG